MAGAPCPAAVHGNYILDDQQHRAYYPGINAIEVIGDGLGNDDGICEIGEECFNRFLVNAVEILGDRVGDDDGLCESGERCIYSPSFGAYQGEGDYLSAGTCLFSDGMVRGVMMYAYPQNGQ